MRHEGDVLLVYYMDRPTVYARIEAIETDIKRGWYHITLLLLTIPTRTVTWILRESYIDGDPFTMDGMPVRLEEVKKTPVESDDKKTVNMSAKVIPFKK